MNAPRGPGRQLLDQAVALHQAGHLQQAEMLYRQVLETDPEQADALYLLGLIAQQFDRNAEAIRLIGRAAHNRPGAAQFHAALGQVLASTGRIDEAIAAFQQATRRAPKVADGYNGLGIVLDTAGRHEEAEKALRRATQLAPDFAVAHYNLGNVLHKLGRPDLAIDAYREAIRLEPDDPEMHSNLGTALMDEVEFDAAIEAFGRALALRPGFAEARLNRALALLVTEQFEEGWREHEFRHEAIGRVLAMPNPWRGQPLAGRSLLVHPEQGFGDSINFVRYLPVLAERGARITMRVQAPLLELFRQSGLQAEFTTEPGGEDTHDFQTALLSIPAILGTDRSSIPAADGYLRASEKKSRAFRERHARGDGLRVGFVWQGNPEQKADRDRSMPLEHMLPLLRTPGITAYALQKGELGESQIAALPADAPITPLGNTLSDFSDTAAALANLDLLVSTCTSVPHLAGAMGTPTWILLARHADWRWFLEPDASPWYRSVRLFRQAARDDWDSVIERVRVELATLAASARD